MGIQLSARSENGGLRIRESVEGTNTYAISVMSNLGTPLAVRLLMNASHARLAVATSPLMVLHILLVRHGA
ncbi:hypothetical protein A7R75_29865 [Mycolicibacterium llatzerense]|nr:hypothetical protein [Mycolicibacterium llatzerense]